jgi:hypothetical protein
MAVAPDPGIHPQALICAAAIVAALPFLTLPAQAGSVTASSIWDKSNAIERARQQLPAGAVVTAERCQETEVGMGNYRYLCTVEFSQPAPAAAFAPRCSVGLFYTPLDAWSLYIENESLV